MSLESKIFFTNKILVFSTTKMAFLAHKVQHSKKLCFSLPLVGCCEFRCLHEQCGKECSKNMILNGEIVRSYQCWIGDLRDLGLKEMEKSAKLPISSTSNARNRLNFIFCGLSSHSSSLVKSSQQFQGGMNLW